MSDPAVDDFNTSTPARHFLMAEVFAHPALIRLLPSPLAGEELAACQKRETGAGRYSKLAWKINMRRSQSPFFDSRTRQRTLSVFVDAKDAEQKLAKLAKE